MPVATKDQKMKIAIKPLHLNFVGERELYFPAIVTEFKDNFETKWKEEEVYGRMDPVSTYSGTGRKINFGFRIISEDADIAKTNLGYLSNLIQYLYPKYQESSSKKNSPSVLQSPPFFEIKFLNVISSVLTAGMGLRGYITSFSHTTPFGSKDTVQIIDNNSSMLLFSDIQVNIGFTVLHEKKIGWYTGWSEDASDGGTNYPYNVPSGEIRGGQINSATSENKPTPIYEQTFEESDEVLLQNDTARTSKVLE